MSALCSQQKGSYRENIVSSVFSTEGTLSAQGSQERGVLKGEHCQLCFFNRGEHFQLCVLNRGGLRGITLSALGSQQRGSSGENIIRSGFVTEVVLKGEHCQLCVRNREGS